MRKPTSGYKGISRIDHEGKNTFGWYVRVCYDHRMHSKFFSDGINGGREKALEAAVKFRDNLEAELGKPRTDRIVVVSNGRNLTGVLGVQRVIKSGKPDISNPTRGMVYEVTWSPEPNVLRKTSFSIEKYGEEQAFRLAVEFRQAREVEIFGKVIQTQVPNFADVKARLDEHLQKKLKKKLKKSK